jgi:hypothetical protein
MTTDIFVYTDQGQSETALAQWPDRMSQIMRNMLLGHLVDDGEEHCIIGNGISGKIWKSTI